MRLILSLTMVAVLGTLSLPGLHAQEARPAEGPKTFQADLYFVAGATKAAGLKVDHLSEPPEVGVWVEGSNPQKLQSLTVAPGQENAAVKYQDLTFRISGLYRGPQKDRMFLRVSFDQGGKAAVKEFLANLDQSVVVTYPMTNGEAGAILVVLTPR